MKIFFFCLFQLSNPFHLTENPKLRSHLLLPISISPLSPLLSCILTVWHLQYSILPPSFVISNCHASFVNLRALCFPLKFLWVYELINWLLKNATLEIIQAILLYGKIIQIIKTMKFGSASIWVLNITTFNELIINQAYTNSPYKCTITLSFYIFIPL